MGLIIFRIVVGISIIISYFRFLESYDKNKTKNTILYQLYNLVALLVLIFSR